MTPPKPVTTVVVWLLASSANLVVLGQHQPYFFNYQPQQHQQPQFQHGTYQPFTNAPPPGAFYQPTYETHTTGRDSGEIINNYFGGGDLPPPTPAANPLVSYPTQVTTINNAPRPSSTAAGHQQPNNYQPVGNSIVQQAPSVQGGNNNNVFRPSPLINHHTHIVNGLPRQQFFGNNYAFFRERHGLTNLPSTTGPFLHNTLHNNNAAPTSSGAPLGGVVRPQSPTPAVFIPTSAAPAPPASPTGSNKRDEPKPSTVQQPRIASPPSTQSTFLQHFPPFHGPSSFAPDSNHVSKPTPSPSNNPVVARLQPAHPTQPSRLGVSGVSPSFAFAQFYPETGNNELPRQPLFGSESEGEEQEEDDSYNSNNNNNGNSIYHENNTQRPPQVNPQRPPPVVSQSVPAKTSSSFGNALGSQAKDEPAPARIHNTQPIRIVFNYEQALQAIEESPGVRVVVAHTSPKPNGTEEFTEGPIQTTSRYVPTTARPPAAHHLISTTYRPAQPPPTSRYEYQPVNVPYQGTGTTAAAALENLALELEGRFGATGRPVVASARPVLETVATLATEATFTESPPTLNTYHRGSKKFIVIPKSDSNVYKAPEPRVVVNDLANIVVQSVPPAAPTTPYTPPAAPTQPSFPHRVTYQHQPPVVYQEPAQQVAVQEVDNSDNDDLEKEIQNLQHELRTTSYVTTTTTTTTTTPPTPPPRPRSTATAAPRLRATTYRPATTYETTRRTRPPPPPPTEEIPETPETLLTLVENPEAPTALTGRQSPRYYYNNKPRGGLSGAHQRYEYNGLDANQQDPQEQVKPIRRKIRPRGRQLIAGSPPRPIQVSAGPTPVGPVVGAEGIPPQLGPLAIGPGGVPLPGGPIGGPGPVFRVGPRGRLLRRKIRPQPGAPPVQEATQPSNPPPRPPTSPLPEFHPVPQVVPQELNQDGPPLYSPTPFLPGSPFVTTFRPGGPPPNLLVQQSIAVEEEQEERRAPSPSPPEETPTTFRSSRFRFSPRPVQNSPVRPAAAPSAPARFGADDDDDDEQPSQSFEHEEEAPVTPPQRRRPSQQAAVTTSTTTERPAQVISDRANILQRQIRFNKNKKQNQRNSS